MRRHEPAFRDATSKFDLFVPDGMPLIWTLNRMQRRGLTWLFRVASAPRRLAMRYLRYNTLFLFYLMKNAVTKRDRSS